MCASSFRCIVTDCSYFVFFFFNDTATTEIYTLSLHDALPISRYLQQAAYIAWKTKRVRGLSFYQWDDEPAKNLGSGTKDRKSTRLNSSHANISYAVFCLKKKQRLEMGSQDYMDHVILR